MGFTSPEVKKSGHEVDNSPPTSAEVKKKWIYTVTTPCLVLYMSKFNFIFNFTLSIQNMWKDNA
jgi:hypothetical protein